MNRAVLEEMRREQRFCDAVLRAEGTPFPVHRIILYCCSPYFQSVFLRWQTPEQVYDIPIVSAAILKIIIQFAYTGKLSVTENNVQELVLASDMLNITSIIDACSDFMSERLCTENCVGIWAFTNICHLPVLCCRAFRCITDYFEEVAENVEFLDLSAPQLAEIISKDELNVSSESVVFNAVIRWIKHTTEERQRHLPTLLAQVRLALTSVEYIGSHVMMNELVRCCRECEYLTHDALHIICHRSSSSSSRLSLSNTISRPRLPFYFLLVTGGWADSGPLTDMELYDPNVDLWTTFKCSMEYPRAYHGCVFLNNYVYLVGGMARDVYFNNVVRLDLSVNRWEEVSPMHHRRCYVSVCVMDGYIYAMGGYDGQVRLNTVERYCPQTNQWSLVAPMNLQRSDGNCATLNNKIYICGGFTGLECLQSAEFYDPCTDEWVITPPMHTRRSGLNVAAYDNGIYAIGGFDGQARLSSVEVYVPATETWTIVSSMNRRRSNFSVTVMGDSLYVVGGYNGYTISHDAEAYRKCTDQWSLIRDAGISRSASSGCALFGLPNMAELTIPRDSLLHLQMEEDKGDLDSVD